MTDNIKYRTYKTSINIFFFSFYSNSKVYEIPEGKSTILPGIKYSVVTILFGWWAFGLHWKTLQKIKNSIVALHVNFDGGEDYTKVFSEMEYEEKTVWVYNNLKREIFEKTNIETIDIIVDLQSEYLQSNLIKSLDKNIMFMNEHLKKLNIINIRNADFEEILNKINQFEHKDL
jgi:hypothetical protein